MDIHKQVDEMLQDVKLAPELSTEDKVRTFLANALEDARWLGCALQQYALPGGYVYGAAIVCDKCRCIHQQLVVPKESEFLLGLPMPPEA